MTLCGSNQNLSLLINPLSPSTLLGVAVTKRHVDSRSETLLGRNFRTVSLNHITPLPSLLNSTVIKSRSPWSLVSEALVVIFVNYCANSFRHFPLVDGFFHPCSSGIMI